jgi:hypothetical protein
MGMLVVSSRPISGSVHTDAVVQVAETSGSLSPQQSDERSAQADGPRPRVHELPACNRDKRALDRHQQWRWTMSRRYQCRMVVAATLGRGRATTRSNNKNKSAIATSP